MENNLSQRNTSIDLYRVLAIFFIAICHTLLPLGEDSNVLYALDFSHSTTDVTLLILCFFRQSGVVGNQMFFLCSAWFLFDSSKWNKKKEWKMIVEIWLISVLFILVYLVTKRNFGIEEIDISTIIRSLFPTMFSNNWYMTSYLFFYLLHPYLNNIIKNMGQKEHLIVSLISFICSFGFGFFGIGLLARTLIVWITIYFCVSYLKTYLYEYTNNIKLNFLLCVLSLIANIGLYLILNYLGLKVDFFNNKLLSLNKHTNPFTICFCFSLFNLIRNLKIKPNKVISTISMMSMYIYIIHDNLLIRHYRPFMWNYVYENFGYEKILFWAFICSVLVFLFGLIGSLSYKWIFQKSVGKFVDKSFDWLCKFFDTVSTFLIKQKS